VSASTSLHPGRRAGHDAWVTASSDLTFWTVDAGSAEARRALAQYFAELDRRFADGFDTDAALGEAVSSFSPPSGLFVIAKFGDDVVGCGAIQWIDETTAEIKRMWVDPGRRGMGLGKRLLAHLEVRARSSGRRRLVLDTNESLTEAISLYQGLGYRAIDRYNDNPYAHHWFEKMLPRTDDHS
jgi:GNAT superfamily N-acetyltransferase